MPSPTAEPSAVTSGRAPSGRTAPDESRNARTPASQRSLSNQALPRQGRIGLSSARTAAAQRTLSTCSLPRRAGADVDPGRSSTL